MTDFDDADQGFFQSLAPDDAIPLALVAVVQWIDPEDGAVHWRSYIDADIPVTQVLGLLELAKADVIRRSNPFPADPDDEDDEL